MKKILGLAVLATVATAGVASAEGTVTANVALTSDYVFRGISLSDNGPAIQGGFDYTTDAWYAGVWGSNVVEGLELDVVGGITPTTGPVDWDIGFIGYFYPGADDDGAEFDYYEIKVGASHDFTDQLTAGAAVYYSPDNYGDTGDATYWEVNASYEITDAIQMLIDRGHEVLAGVYGGRWFDTGTLDSFLESSSFLTDGASRIDPSAQVTGLVGSRVVVGAGASVVCDSIEDATILPGAQITVSGRIEHSILAGAVTIQGDVMGQIVDGRMD